jgi:hypothetical protein
MEPHYQALVKAVRQISSLPPGPAPPVPLPPPPSSKRFTRLLPILAGVAALLVALGIVASLYWEPPNPTPLESLRPPPKTSHLTPPQEVIGRTNPAVPASGNWAGFSETGTTVCSPGSFVTSIQGFKSDTQGTHEEPKGLHHFLSELRYACGDSEGWEVEIGKTNPAVPGVASWAGFSGTGTTVCPPSSFVTSIQGFKSDTQGTHEEPKGLHAFISELRYVCRAPDGSVVQIGKTNPKVPDSGSWTGTPAPPGFSGTGTTDCPQGKFINSIQGFKSDPQDGPLEHNFISELRYTCA